METEVSTLDWLQPGKMRKRYEEVHRRIYGKDQRAAFHENVLEATGKAWII